MGESINWSDDPLQVYLSAVSEVPPLEKSEETACIDHVRAGDEMADMARKRLVEANLHLVVSRAEHYRQGNIHILDLIVQGNAGLSLAVQSLAGHSPSSFSEYAIPFIERALAEAKVSEPISPAHKQ